MPWEDFIYIYIYTRYVNACNKDARLVVKETGASREIEK